VIVKPQKPSDSTARESLFVEFGSLRDLRVGHSAGCVYSVFSEDAGDRRARDLKLCGDGSDAADLEVANNDEVDFIGSQLSSSPARNAAGFPRFSSGRSEEQLLGCDDPGCGVRVNL